MSDFLKSLSARSFGLEGELESVRPRLPSLFEVPRANWGVPQEESIAETSETGPLQNGSAPSSLGLHSRTTGPEHSAVKKVESEPVLTLNTVSGGFDAKLSAHSEPDLSLTPRQPASPAISQDRFDGSEKRFQTHQETAIQSNLTKYTDTNKSVSEGLSKKKFASIPAFKSSMPTTNGPKPDYKFTGPELFQNKRPAQNEPQLQQAEARPKSMQTASLVVDSSVLERLVTNKIGLHTQVHNSIGDKSSNSGSKQQDILPRVDSQLSAKRSTLQPAPGNQVVNARDEPEQTIQVTIGRIEIRATPPSNVTRKNTENKPSTMSLEEYLSKRNGGAR